MKKTVFNLSLAAGCFIGALAFGAANAQAYKAPEGVNAAQARDLIGRFERLTGIRGQVAFYLADMTMADAAGPNGRVVSQRRLSGLPEGLSRWLQKDQVASRSALFFVQAEPGSRPLCAVVQTQKNLAGSTEQRMRERLSRAYGADAWGWMIAHELGHCARSVLSDAGQASRERGPSASSEAFADIFALEWMRRENDPGFERYQAALTQEREGSGEEHRIGPFLTRYQAQRASAPKGESVCQTALRFSQPAGPLGAIAHLSC